MLRPYTAENIEELFYTVDCFRNLETDMPGFEEGDLIPQFPLLLSDQTARREWQRLVLANNYLLTADGFEQAVVDLTNAFVQDKSAKETFLTAMQA